MTFHSRSLRLPTADLPRFPSLAGLRRLLRRWRQRSDERATLAALSTRELRDMGMTTNELEREINKPFWRA